MPTPWEEYGGLPAVEDAPSEAMPWEEFGGLPPEEPAAKPELKPVPLGQIFSKLSLPNIQAGWQSLKPTKGLLPSIEKGFEESIGVGSSLGDTI